MFLSSSQVPPPFFDKPFFERVLRSHLGSSDVTFKGVSYREATKPGQNFCCIVLLAKILYEDASGSQKELKVFTKSVPEKSYFDISVMRYKDVFETEVELYTRVLPAVKKLLQSIGDASKLAPDYVYHEMEPQLVLVLEDLAASGFQVPEDLLDLDRTKLVVSALAKFHAASMVVNEQNDHFVEAIQNSYFHKNDSISNKLFIPDMALLIELVRDKEGFQEIATRLQRFKENFIQNLDNVYKFPERKKLPTLCHTDFYIKNMLISEKPLDVAIIDFQACSWGTGVIDLFFVLYQVADLGTRNRHRRDILRHYHAVLTDTLQKLKYTGHVVTFEELEGEVRENSAAEVLQIVSSYKYRFMRWDVEGLEAKIEADPGYQTRQVFQNPEYLAIAKVEFERLIEIGAL